MDTKQTKLHTIKKKGRIPYFLLLFVLKKNKGGTKKNMTNCVRDVTVSLFDQLVHTPYLVRSKTAIIACEHQLPGDDMPGLRELLFALDHHDLCPSESLEGCCRPVWSLIEDECKWNTQVFIQRFIIDRMRGIVPFETLVYIAQLLPMLLVGKTNCQVTSCVCREDTFFPLEPTARKSTLVATDFDGTYGCKVDPLPPLEPTLCISERTWGEFTKDIKNVMQRMPVYIRGTGKSGDVLASAMFKAAMIKQFGVTHFLENDTLQIEMLQQLCPELVICKVI